MRTTLYLSAALAAMGFNLGASAASPAPTKLNQETALAQTYLDADINLESETEIVGRSEELDMLVDMLEHGYEVNEDDEDEEEALRDTVVNFLRAGNVGKGIVIDSVKKWFDFSNDSYEIQSLSYQEKMLASVLDPEGWKTFVAYLKTLPTP